MAPTARTAKPARFRQGRWLPLTISLGVHALFLPFVCYAAYRSSPSTGPATPDSRVWDTEVRLSLSESGSPRPRKAEAPGAEESEDNSPPVIVHVDSTPRPVFFPRAVEP